MDANDEFDIDPAIAAAMGFSGFGGQKKRKFDANDGFVDPNITVTAQSSTGANSAPLGQKKIAKTGDGAASITAAATLGTPQNAGGDSKPSLEALRHGVRNERGDMVYFMPSFIEDPWAKLKAK